MDSFNPISLYEVTFSNGHEVRLVLMSNPKTTQIVFFYLVIKLYKRDSEVPNIKDLLQIMVLA